MEAFAQGSRRPRRASLASRLVFLSALVLHLSFLVSLRLGTWHRFAFDTVATGGRLGWDYYALHQAGHNVLVGESIYESDNARLDVIVPRHTPYRYLPLPACSLGVLANALAAAQAYGTWVVIVEVLLCTGCYAAWRWAGGGSRGLFVAALWLAYTPVYVELYLGQFNVVQAILLLVLLRELGRRSSGDDRLLGAAWTASLLWKQNTALVAPVFIAQKRWRVLLGAALGVVGLSLPYLLATPGALPAFANNLFPGPLSHALGNLGARQLIFSVSSQIVPDPQWVGHHMLQALWVLVVLVVSIRGTVCSGENGALLAACLWIAAFFLLYHDVWEHHYVLLLPVFTALFALDGSRWLVAAAVLCAAWTPYRWLDPTGRAILDASFRWTPLRPGVLDILYHATKALPVLLVWVYLVGHRVEPRRATRGMRP